MLKAKPEQSNRAIAKQVKANDKTVATVRCDLESTAEIPQLEKTVGADGKSRKSKPKGKAAAEHAPPPARCPCPSCTDQHATAINSKDTALETFDAHVLELLRLTKGQKPQRFAKTAIPQPLLGDLAHFLREVVTRPQAGERGRVMSGRRSRDKGGRRERSVTAALQDAGFAAEKISGMYKTGADISLPLLGIDRAVEVKGRASGLKKIREWMIDRFAVVVWVDREQPIVVLRLADALEIARAAERGRR